MDRYDKAYINTAFFIQAVLLVYFLWRKINFDGALLIGWVVYAMAIPAGMVSILLIVARKHWYLWAAGIAYIFWAVLAFVVDIAAPISWRSPVNYPIFIPYVLLYMTSQMFYWWPLGTFSRKLWFLYTALFIASTILNVSSHTW